MALVIGISVIITTPSLPTYKIPTTSSLPHDSMGMMHIHPHLSMTIDGNPVVIPANIGIDSHLWNVHTLDSYGMTGMAPLHTHTADGVIHVESYKDQGYTLGQFLDIWGIPIDNYDVKVTVDGNPISDYRNHVFQDGEKIVMNLTTK
ncbi:MAG: hypothetical protein KGH86_08115 [Thaumarchaeota archaeon]|nr:hypothetical protein [Nitrososphaerota archaeon]